MAGFDSYSILFLIGLISIISAIFRTARTRSHLPPGPVALPIIGHLHLLTPISPQALHKLSNRYGPLTHLRLGSVPCVVISSPEMAKEVLKTHGTSITNRPQSETVRLSTNGMANLSSAPYGPYWKFMKKLCVTELLSGRIIDQFLPVRHDEIKSFLQLILKKAQAGEAVDVKGELVCLMNNIISRMSMSRRCSETRDEASELRKVLQESSKITGTLNLADYFGICKYFDLQGIKKRLKIFYEKFDVIMERIIEEHEEARKNTEMGDDGVHAKKDVIDILLDILEDESSEIRLTRDNIKAFILDIFIAGTRSSATTAEWALSELINHRSVMEKARQEIDFVIGKSRLVEESDIRKLPYLQAIVKETLRLHPPSPIVSREPTENTKVGGYDIPAKTWLLINVWAIGRDPLHWENPLEFQPERFISETGSEEGNLDVRGQHFQLLPFGSGRRGCPGISLALQSVQTTLAAMIQCFDWNVGDETMHKANMEETPHLVTLRRAPLLCSPVARLDPLPFMQPT